MIEEIARGLGIVSFDGGPPPGPTLSGSGTRHLGLGHIPLVAARGEARWASYRMIYLTNPWVWAAVNMLSRGIARLPVHVYALNGDGEKERIRGDLPKPGPSSPGERLDQLLQTPTRGSRFSMIKGTVTERLVLGNSLWEIVRDGSSQPADLDPIRWRDVQRIHEDDVGNVLYYELRRREGEQRSRKLLPADVVHFGLGDDPDGSCGISPLQACSATLALHDAVVRHLLGYFENSARMSGHLEVDKLNADKARELREMITEMYASPENAGKVLVASGKWTTISDSPDHAQVVELIHNSREEIAAAYAIPPPVLGILDRAIKSNVNELRTQYIRDGIGTWTAEFESTLAAQLLDPVPSWSSLYAEFELGEQLRPDLEARSLVYQRMAAVLTIDEIRGMENKPALKIPGVTDVPWASSGSMPVTEARGQKSGRVNAA